MPEKMTEEKLEAQRVYDEAERSIGNAITLFTKMLVETEMPGRSEYRLTWIKDQIKELVEIRGYMK